MNKIDKAREILNWLFLIGTANSIFLWLYQSCSFRSALFNEFFF